MLFLVPQSVEGYANSTSAMKVVIVSPNVTFAISLYKASALPSCYKVPPNVSPLLCLITGLPAATRFKIKAYACASGGVCSSPVVGVGYTLATF